MRNKNEECPSDEFEDGTPSGSCWGDGHYMCESCKHFRKDFVGIDGIEKRSEILRFQCQIKITTL